MRHREAALRAIDSRSDELGAEASDRLEASADALRSLLIAVQVVQCRLSPETRLRPRRSPRLKRCGLKASGSRRREDGKPRMLASRNAYGMSGPRGSRRCSPAIDTADLPALGRCACGARGGPRPARVRPAAATPTQPTQIRMRGRRDSRARHAVGTGHRARAAFPTPGAERPRVGPTTGHFAALA